MNQWFVCFANRQTNPDTNKSNKIMTFFIAAGEKDSIKHGTQNQQFKPKIRVFSLGTYS